MAAESERGGLQEKIADLRRHAARARRLMVEMTIQADRRLLRKFAEELEARAAELERSAED